LREAILELPAVLITLYEQTLAARERVLGPDHRDTLASRGSLAHAYQAAGRSERETLGASYPDHGKLMCFADGPPTASGHGDAQVQPLGRPGRSTTHPAA
jgi:hypothetical protein